MYFFLQYLLLVFTVKLQFRNIYITDEYCLLIKNLEHRVFFSYYCCYNEKGEQSHFLVY